MTPERAKIARLRRIERLRGIEHRISIAEAARAETALAGAGALATRTARLAAGYAGRAEAENGAALARYQSFTAGLASLHAGANAGAASARDRADTARLAALAAQQRAETVVMLASTAAAALARRDGQRAHAELARKLKGSVRHAATRESRNDV